MSAIIFKNDLYAYDEEDGAEVEIEGLKAKFIKESFGDVFYLLDEPIEGKRVIKEYYSEPIGEEIGVNLYDLISEVDA
jgi:hypothetical protein